MGYLVARLPTQILRRDQVIGLIVNPVAGIGGPAGLKGSDGDDIQAEARGRGSVPRATERAEIALREFARGNPGARILTVQGSMGENAVVGAGLEPQVVYRPAEEHTTATDTGAAAAALAASGASMILFVGGDGTARDVSAAIPPGTPAIGIPAGVKMYSGCFAVSPVAAGAIAAQSLIGGLPLQRREVLDVSEDQVRAGRVDPSLFGYLDVPYVPGRTQARKASSIGSESDAVRNAAQGAVRQLRPGVAYLLGPGSTMATVAAVLGVKKTSLGVDVVLDGQLILADASERQLLRLVARMPSRAVVTVIGGQGFLLGRGNQQLSAAVIRALGDDPLLVVATDDKLIALGGRPLLVDTGDAGVDASLAGFIRVVTGEAASSFYRVAAADAAPELTTMSTKENS
jgi:predicted polyphosphate/ATP-dependent NAD kinase